MLSSLSTVSGDVFGAAAQELVSLAPKAAGELGWQVADVRRTEAGCWKLWVAAPGGTSVGGEGSGEGRLQGPCLIYIQDLDTLGSVVRLFGPGPALVDAVARQRFLTTLARLWRAEIRARGAAADAALESEATFAVGDVGAAPVGPALPVAAAPVDASSAA